MFRLERWVRRRTWLVAGFSIVLAIVWTVAIRTISVAFGQVAFDDAAELIAAQDARLAIYVRLRTVRSYLITGSTQTLAQARVAQQETARELERLRVALAEHPSDQSLLGTVERADRDSQAAIAGAVELRQAGRRPEEVLAIYEREIHPAREALDTALTALTTTKKEGLSAAAASAKQTVLESIVLLVGTALLAAALSVVLWRDLRRTLEALRAERDEVARQAARVREVNRELDAFAGRVSHDLRNLLSPIGLGAALARRSAGDHARLEAAVARIEHGIERATGVLNGLLVFSRAGRPDPAASCSVRAAVGEAVEQLAPLAARIGAAVELDLDEARVACSQELLGVVALNLVGNSLKFLEGCPRRVVELRSTLAGEWVELAVTDTGPGIPEDALSRVFEPFFRVPGANGTGSGIGLATVRRIVEAHRGSIAVESELERGATFRVRLPRAPATAGERAASGRRGEAERDHPSSAPPMAPRPRIAGS